MDKPARKPSSRRPNTPTPRTPEVPVFPMRINKYLAVQKHSTRRGADELITSNKVFINGRPAVLGDKVMATDHVEVRFRGKAIPTGNPASNVPYTYVAFNKPVGVPTEDIVKSMPKDLKVKKVFPLGRLDKESHGLILLTNDGRVTDRLLNPKFDHHKVYEVEVTEPLRNNFKERIEGGVNIEGYITKPAQAEKLGENKFRITLTEGKTHQIRRMVSALFNTVTDLKRVQIENVMLGKLPQGDFRPIEGDELREFLKRIDL